VVFFEDECHLLWGDVTGYVWGKRQDRIEIPVVNQRDKQTYYGALNVVTGKCLVQAYKKGDSAATLALAGNAQTVMILGVMIDGGVRRLSLHL